VNITFRINTLIEWDAEEGDPLVERILFIDPTGTDVVTIVVNDKNALPVFKKLEVLRQAIIADRARIIFKASCWAEPSLPEEDHPKYCEYIKRRDEAWALIAPLVEIQDHKIFNRRERGRLVSELAKRTGRRKSAIYDSLRRYWQRGFSKDALIPAWHNSGRIKDEKERKIDRKRGRKSAKALRTGVDTGRNVTPEDKEKFDLGIKRYIRTGKAKNLRDAWQLIKERYYTVGEQELTDGTKAPLLPHASTLPTFRQFEYYYRKTRNRKAELIGGYGLVAYDRDHSPILGDSAKMAFGPGAVYQIDATIGDIYLLNYLDRKLLIGRPVIYLVIDVFSRLIVGLAVTLEGPSWEGARLALECAFLNKVAFCERFGVTINEADWPVEGICEGLLGDNGEIKGYNVNSLVDPLDIRVANAAVARPDWKAIVERRFRMINDLFIEWRPGEVRPRREIKGKDYRLEATLDLNQFRRMMIKCVLHYNNSHRLKKYRKDEFMIPKNIEPVPINLWSYGMKLRTGKLRSESEEKIRLNLLPKDKASTTPQGIYYKGLYYTCDMAIQDQLFLRHKGKRTTRFSIVSEPLVDRIHLRLDRGRRFVTCELTPACQRFQGRDWYEMKEYFALERQAEKDAETTVQQSKANFHAEINSIVDEGKKMTKEALADAELSNHARTAGVRRNRKALKSYERKHGAGTVAEKGAVTNQDSTDKAKVVQFKKPRKSDDKGYVPPAKPYDELRKARSEALEDGE
jgi:putative transposase